MLTDNIVFLINLGYCYILCNLIFLIWCQQLHGSFLMRPDISLSFKNLWSLLHDVRRRLSRFNPTRVVANNILVVEFRHCLNFSIDLMTLDIFVEGEVDPDFLDSIVMLVKSMSDLKDLAEAPRSQHGYFFERLRIAILLQVTGVSVVVRIPDLYLQRFIFIIAWRLRNINLTSESGSFEVVSSLSFFNFINFHYWDLRTASHL